MRISDWSSDVCSSDLFGLHEEVTAENCGAIANLGFIIGGKSVAVVDTGTTRQEGEALRAAVAVATDRPISQDRKSVVEGKSGSVRVDLGGRRLIKKKNNKINVLKQ